MEGKYILEVKFIYFRERFIDLFFLELFVEIIRVMVLEILFLFFQGEFVYLKDEVFFLRGGGVSMLGIV